MAPTLSSRRQPPLHNYTTPACPGLAEFALLEFLLALARAHFERLQPGRLTCQRASAINGSRALCGGVGHGERMAPQRSLTHPLDEANLDAVGVGHDAVGVQDGA